MRRFLWLVLVFLWAGSVHAAEPPVILIHGLWGSADSWQKMADTLVAAGWQEGDIIRFPSNSISGTVASVYRSNANLAGAAAWRPNTTNKPVPGKRIFYRVEFENNDGQTFEMQGKQVAEAVRLVRQWTGADKVVLAGHSMGGLAARAYLQSAGYRGDVCGLVTVDTPHLGSLLPYLRKEDAPTCVRLAKWSGHSLSALAVRHLAPDSQEMMDLNTPGGVFGELPADVNYFCLIGHYSDTGESGNCVSKRSQYFSHWQQALSKRMTGPAGYASAAVWANWTDSIVPCVSQYLKACAPAAALDVKWKVLEDCDHSGATERTEDILKAIETASACGSRFLDLVLVIDSSGSMGQNDPHDLRKQASSLVVDRLAPIDICTVVDFDDKAKVLADADSDKQVLKRAISQINSDGGTNIGAGLKTAFNALDMRKNGARKGVILLTDGVGDYHGEADLFRKKGWPVFTIGLLGNTNEALLSKIALETGGMYFKARSAADQQKLFATIFGRLSNQNLVTLIKGKVKQGETVTHTFNVDSALDSIMVTLNWPGSDLNLELLSPSGTVYQPTVKESTYELLDLQNPVPGQWQARVTGIQVSRSEEPFDIMVAADTPLSVREKGLNRNYRPGEPMLVELELSGVFGLTGVMRVTDPAGRQLIVKGQNSGGSMIFKVADTRTSGDYDIFYQLAGKEASGAPVTRVGLHTIHVSGRLYEQGLGHVLSVNGQYVTINMGSRIGVRPGIRVNFYISFSNRTVTAEGFVISAKRNSAIVELQMVRAMEPRRGMPAKLNPDDWKAD